jgi:hypothetical protein
MVFAVRRQLPILPWRDPAIVTSVSRSEDDVRGTTA